jgi:hypothetical protein
MICMTVLYEPHRSFFFFFLSVTKNTHKVQIDTFRKFLPKEEYFIVKIYCVFTKLFIYLHNTILLKTINETS